VPEITREQQDDAMISGIQALAAVGGEKYRPTFDHLATADPSLKVRQAAIEAKRDLEKR
jgi:hypothetical protein